jgi:RIO kinase 1
MRVLPNFQLFQFVTDPQYKFPATSSSPIDVDASTITIDELKEKLNEMLGEYSEAEDFADENDCDDKEAENAMIEEAVFLQSYIPTSLSDISNPQKEMNRLKGGEREPVYEAAVRKMLGVNVGPDSSNALKNSSSDNEVIINNDSNSDDNENDEREYYTSGEDTRYKRTLPSHNDPDARLKAKNERKEACRIAKEKAAEKRKVKIPKHIKKKAVKGNKK